jgi:hypothetical protein
MTPENVIGLRNEPARPAGQPRNVPPGGRVTTPAVCPHNPFKVEADGTTLLVQSASHAANSAICKSLPYEVRAGWT